MKRNYILEIYSILESTQSISIKLSKIEEIYFDSKLDETLSFQEFIKVRIIVNNFMNQFI